MQDRRRLSGYPCRYYSSDQTFHNGHAFAFPSILNDWGVFPTIVFEKCEECVAKSPDRLEPNRFGSHELSITLLETGKQIWLRTLYQARTEIKDTWERLEAAFSLLHRAAI